MSHKFYIYIMYSINQQKCLDVNTLHISSVYIPTLYGRGCKVTCLGVCVFLLFCFITLCHNILRWKDILPCSKWNLNLIDTKLKDKGDVFRCKLGRDVYITSHRSTRPLSQSLMLCTADLNNFGWTEIIGSRNVIYALKIGHTEHELLFHWSWWM